jgi:hypothetical protein
MMQKIENNKQMAILNQAIFESRLDQVNLKQTIKD